MSTAGSYLDHQTAQAALGLGYTGKLYNPADFVADPVNFPGATQSIADTPGSWIKYLLDWLEGHPPRLGDPCNTRYCNLAMPGFSGDLTLARALATAVGVLYTAGQSAVDICNSIIAAA